MKAGGGADPAADIKLWGSGSRAGYLRSIFPRNKIKFFRRAA